MEKVLIVMPDDQTFTYHTRQHYAGSNRGDVVGPIKAPSWDDSWIEILKLWSKKFTVSFDISVSQSQLSKNHTANAICLVAVK